MQKPINLPVQTTAKATSDERPSHHFRQTPTLPSTGSPCPRGESGDQVVGQAYPAALNPPCISELSDSALLIGLTMQFARMGNFRPGSVPNVILTQLGQHGLAGDHAALLVLRHIHRRALLQITGPHGRIRLKPTTNSAIGGAA